MRKYKNVSIVIATKGRVGLLRELLESLVAARQNFEGLTEVILIDDSEEKDTEEIQKLCEELGARREFYSPSVAGKRNYGAKVARYEIILFLDSDCMATENLLTEHVCKFDDDKVGAVAGPLQFVGNENWFWKSVILTPYLICFQMPLWGKTSPWGTTANLSVRKDIFFRIGGFDEKFPNKPGGEDVDLGLRIVKQGFVIANTQQGLVYHNKDTWSRVRPMFKRAWYYGGADYYLISKHAELTADAIPRRVLIMFLVILCCLILTCTKSIWCVLGIPIWIFLDILFMSIFMSRYGHEKSSVLHQAVAQLLILTNEMGFVSTCIKHKKIKYCLKQMVYFDNQISGIAYNGNCYFWCFISSFFLIFLICILLLR